jgi:hypothetical protein
MPSICGARAARPRTVMMMDRCIQIAINLLLLPVMMMDRCIQIAINLLLLPVMVIDRCIQIALNTIITTCDGH